VGRGWSWWERRSQARDFCNMTFRCRPQIAFLSHKWERTFSGRKDSFIHRNATAESEFGQYNGLGALQNWLGSTDYYRVPGIFFTVPTTLKWHFNPLGWVYADAKKDFSTRLRLFAISAPLRSSGWWCGALTTRRWSSLYRTRVIYTGFSGLGDILIKKVSLRATFKKIQLTAC